MPLVTNASCGRLQACGGHRQQSQRLHVQLGLRSWIFTSWSTILFRQGICKEDLCPRILSVLRENPFSEQGDLLEHLLDDLNRQDYLPPATVIEALDLLAMFPEAELEEDSLLGLAVWRFKHDHA